VFINGKQIDEIPMINFPKIACNEPMDPYNNNNNKKKTLEVTSLSFTNLRVIGGLHGR
jgi:hypothetical protein